MAIDEKSREWKRPVIAGGEVPRRAGGSSFGAGGANAHVVIEEYIPAGGEHAPITVIPRHPVLIVLSARDGERLDELAGRLSSRLGERQSADAGLANIAYTLQTGREPMEERLAMMANSIEELLEKIEGFLEGRGAGGVHRGRVKRHKESLAIFEPDGELEEQVDAWIIEGKYSELAAQWVRGMIIDWRKLYTGTLPRRISLPLYPFAREHFWVPEREDEKQIHATLTPPAGTIPFDEKFYDRLLDDVARDTLGVDEAARKIRSGV